MDVTPRETPETPKSKSRRTLPFLIVLAVLVAAGGFVVVRALGNSTMFFYNVDEAVAQRDSLGSKRFRLQGVVVADSVERTGDGVTFEVTFGGVTVPVNHVGDPPELFQPNIPVVLEGQWDTASPNGAFSSDRILVKHTNEYEEKHPDRITDATTDVRPDAATGTPDSVPS